MSFENKYPYTDFHELNLDWFLQEFNKLLKEWADLAADNAEFKQTMTERFGTLSATVQEFTTFVTNYFDNLDVQQEINHKLNDMVEDGTMSELLRPYFNAFTVEINARMRNQDDKITVLEGRMDTFASLPDGSTAGDAELEDIRIGANGHVYSSAGNAVRGQITDIQTPLEELQEEMIDVIGDPPVTISSFDEYEEHNGIIGSDGTWKNVNSNYKHIAVPVKKGYVVQFLISSASTENCVFAGVESYDPDNIVTNASANVSPFGRKTATPGVLQNWEITDDYTRFLIITLIYNGYNIPIAEVNITYAGIEGDLEQLEDSVTNLTGHVNELGEEIEELQEEMIDIIGDPPVTISSFDGYEEHNGIIGSDGTWKNVNSNYKHIAVPVKKGYAIQFLISSASTENCVFAGVESYDPNNIETNASAHVSPFGRRTATHGVLQNWEITDDYTKFMIFTLRYNNYDIPVQTVNITYAGVKGDIENLNDRMDALEKEAVNILIIGDSYSHNEDRYIKYMREHMKINDLINLSVTSAHLKDNYEDRTEYPYDARPINTGTGNNNTFNNQIAKLERLMTGTDLDPGEEQIYTSSDDYPDIILIEGGKNDGYDASDDYENEMWSSVTGYCLNATGNTYYGTTYIPVDYEDTNRTNFGGAMHYQYGKLHSIFPNAKIFYITPSGINYSNANHTAYMLKADQMRKAARYLCMPVIDWDLEGRLSYVDNVVNGTGTQEDPYTRNASSEFTIDSLHPNLKGGNLLGAVIVAKLRSYGYTN